MSKLIHVGGSFADDRRRILAAADRAERGEPIEPESHLSFESWAAFFRVLTPGRIELLHHVYTHGGGAEQSLAHDLGRTYRDVHDDVTALQAVGLIERHGASVVTEWDVDQADIEAA